MKKEKRGEKMDKIFKKIAEELNIRDFIIEPIYIHKSKSITTVLRTFRETK